MLKDGVEFAASLGAADAQSKESIRDPKVPREIDNPLSIADYLGRSFCNGRK